jgi:seryl-tRNA synthetase
MTAKPSFTTANGLATLGAKLIRLRNQLESRFLQWADEWNAEAMLFPPLMRVADLDKLDYFRNFPHLVTIASRIRPECLTADYPNSSPVDSIPSSHLDSSQYVLPSAACYSIYIHLRDSVLDAPKYVTTVATCFRNENEYKGLQRLLGFTMREIVCIGDSETVKTYLDTFKRRLSAFAAEIDLPLEKQVATDPFYQPQSSRALVQSLFPVKEEFVYGGSVAIASGNFHRNFFGERCNIRMADGSLAHSGCVAFGIERWLHALIDRFGEDVDIEAGNRSRNE